MPMPVPAPAPPRSALSKQLVLESLDLFKTVKSPTLEWLTNQLQRRRLEKSECLFSVGDTADALYIVAEGCVRVWTVSSAGVEITLNVLTPGAILGEIGMLDGSVRTAGASAMLPSDLWIIQRRVFFDALDRDPALARNVITLLCHRLRWVSARMEDAALLQAPQRLARIVCHLARDHGIPASGSVRCKVGSSMSDASTIA